MPKQPEALATFAATARNEGRKPDDIGLEATPETSGIPTDPDQKAKAATKVLREGVLHRDQGADEAVDALPDRTRDKREDGAMRHGNGNQMTPEQEAAVRSREPAKKDAAGQYAASQAEPNADGLVSANPVVLSGDGDATPGNGHGRDRDDEGPKSG